MREERSVTPSRHGVAGRHRTGYSSRFWHRLPAAVPEGKDAKIERSTGVIVPLTRLVRETIINEV
jgi:hypothetical protein